MISQDWQRRIAALADVDSMDAAEQVLQYVQVPLRSRPLRLRHGGRAVDLDRDPTPSVGREAPATPTASPP